MPGAVLAIATYFSHPTEKMSIHNNLPLTDGKAEIKRS